jgi:hypothetical protein
VAADIDDSQHPEGINQDDLDNIKANWPTFAAFAWSGYRALGPGVVLVDVQGDETADLTYVGGCECHAHLVRPYDPHHQVVVAVCRNSTEHVYVLSGSPSPQEALECAHATMPEGDEGQ